MALFLASASAAPQLILDDFESAPVVNARNVPTTDAEGRTVLYDEPFNVSFTFYKPRPINLSFY